MIKIILLLSICYLTVSCNSKSKNENDDVQTSTDTSKNKPTNIAALDIAIDPVQVSPDKYRVLLENDNVRVVLYSLAPGEKDNTHTHPAKTSYVLSGGTVRVYPEHQEPIDFEEVIGVAEWSDKRGKHYVENIGQTTVSILLTEIKERQNKSEVNSEK